MFEYFGHIHVYSPGISPTAGADNSLGPKHYHKHKHFLSIYSFLASFLPLNDIFLFYPIQIHGGPKLTLP